ncbi:MAG: hypothetical protein ABI204_05925 [Ginsengibacter sp.]
MSARISDIKKELENKSRQEILEYCLRLGKFKKENKEFLSFLLFEAEDINAYIEKVNGETTNFFGEINLSNVYFIKKSIRKIVRNMNKHIRFTASAQTEAEILIHFCNCFERNSLHQKKSRQLENIFISQVKKAEVALSSLHPDLQYDLQQKKDF